MKTCRPRDVFTTLLFVVVGLAVFLSGCSAETVPSADPQAWIDSPLEGSSFPVGLVPLMAHAADPAGIEMIEMRIDDHIIAIREPDESTGSLARLSWEWSATEPGVFLVQVRAQNKSGLWSEYDQSLVTIAGEVTQTATATHTRTPTATYTQSASPTPSPSSSPTATPTAGSGSIGAPSLSTDEVRYSGSCTPSQVTWQVAAQHPSGISSMFLFHRLEDIDSGQLTGWSSGRAMSSSGGGTYQLTLTGDQIASVVGYNGQAARVHYQIVLQPSQGETQRSPVYQNLTLKKCGIIIIIPPLLPTPTGSPVVK